MPTASVDRRTMPKRNLRQQAAGRLQQGARGPKLQFVPGPGLIRWACGLVGIALAYAFFRSSVMLWLGGLYAAGLATVATLEGRRVAGVMKGLGVRRALPLAAGRSLPFRIAWTLTRGPAPARPDEAIVGELRDVVPASTLPALVRLPFTLPTGQTAINLDQEVRITQRGRHAFGPLWIRVLGPRRFIDVQAAWDLPGDVKVLPERFASRDEFAKEEGAEQLLFDRNIRTRQHGAGAEFESLHEFRDGDDPRKIDWRATGRMRRPVIRKYQIERHRDVMIIIDSGRLMGTQTDRGTKLDCAVDAALILARTVLSGGDRCGIAAYDNGLRAYVPPQSGKPSLQTLVDAVYDLHSEFQESDFGPVFVALQRRQAKRSLIVVLSDVTESETSEGLRSSLFVLSRRHVVLFAALRTPALRQVVHGPAKDFNAAAEHAVAHRLLRDRRHTIQSLGRGGIHVLDVEPQRMTVPLINQFLDLRNRDLL